MNRLGRLDHLRAIAAFMVVAWHFAFAFPFPVAHAFQAISIFKQGWTGVSFFCVISGFILTHIYIDRNMDYRSFIKNRFLRIAPLYLLIVCLTYYVSDWDLATLVLTTLTGMSRGGLPSIAGAGWTVLIEFQFYLLFPFILLFYAKYGMKYLFGLLCMTILIKVAVWNGMGTVQLISYYSIFGRIDQFLIGMLAAVAIRNLTVKRLLFRSSFSIGTLLAGTVAVLFLFRWFNAKGGLLNFEGAPWPSKSVLWVFLPATEGVFYALVIIGYLHVPTVRFMAFLARPLAHVGRVSYSIYLIHILMLTTLYQCIARLGIAPKSYEQTLLLCGVFAMPYLVLVSSLTYYCVELPFMNMRNSGSVKRRGILAGAGDMPQVERAPSNRAPA